MLDFQALVAKWKSSLLEARFEYSLSLLAVRESVISGRVVEHVQVRNEGDYNERKRDQMSCAPSIFLRGLSRFGFWLWLVGEHNVSDEV